MVRPRLRPGVGRRLSGAPEEWSVPDWTPIAAVPLVDTRFDLGDVLDVVSDSAGTVPIEDLGGGELAFVHDETFQGTLAPDWLLLPQESAGGTLVLGEVEAATLNVALGPVAFTDSLSVELEVEQPEGVASMPSTCPEAN